MQYPIIDPAIVRFRRRGATALALLLSIGQAKAAQQKLADFSYAGHHVAEGAVVINTSGPARVRVTFPTPATARVEIAPGGRFSPNISPAVESPLATRTDVKVEDAGDALLVRSTALTLRIDKKRLRIDAYDAKNAKPVSLESPDDGTAWDDASGAIRQSRMLDQAEHVYGLGQDNANRGTLDRRGTQREMWTGQQIKSGNVTAQYPVPFYLSTGAAGRGYGCFVDSSWKLQFDVGKTHHDRLTWTAPGGPIDYYLFAGSAFKDIVGDFTRLTGRPSMLPLWAFGFWQSRCFYQSFPEIEQAAARLQKDGVPLDVMVVDSAWSNHEMDYKWSDKFLAGTPATEWFKRFHDRGLHVIVSTKGPMIRPDTDIYAEAKSLGVFADDGKGNPIIAGYFGGHLLDATAPNLYDFLKRLLTPLTRQGTDGWWLDLNEPEGEPPQTVYHGGTSADTHNRYSLLNNKLYFDYEREIHPTGRPVILGRAATAGTQRYSGIVWSGDINSDWPTFRAHIPEAQNTGLSGLPYWTNDSGGFLSGFLSNDRYGAHAALYERWFEFTCFAPIARAHKAGPSEPYEYGPAVEATAKKYLDLRYRLMPYLYQLAHEAATSGLPMLRPLVLEYQGDAGSQTAKTEFLFGPDLLVAPVIWANVTARTVYFPPGEWISFDEGFQVSGGQAIGVAAPRDRIPLFVRAGAILPMAPSMTHTGQKPWDPITLEVWPHGTSAGSLYQDDGETTEYERGQFTTTAFESVQDQGKRVTFTIKPSNNQFGPAQWVLRFHLTSNPIAVTIDGTALEAGADGWAFDGATQVLTAKVPGCRVAHAIDVTLDGSAHPRPTAPKVDVPAVDESDAAGPQQTAQFLPPPKLPIRIDAANYDKGGEGLAFHVAAPATTDLYRKDGVPIAASDDAGGGYVVPGLKSGDWLAYTIDGVDGGWFTARARARTTTGGALSILRARTTRLTDAAVPPAKSGVPAWVDASGATSFFLPPGEQIVTVRVEQPGVDLGHFMFEKIKDLGPAAEAETGERTGTSGVQNDHPGHTGTGFVSGVRNPGDVVTLHLNVATAGTYPLAVRYANGSDDAKIDITANGKPPVRATIPSLGNWNDYGEAAVPVVLSAGDNVIKIEGTGQGVINFDQIHVLTAPADRSDEGPQ